MRPEPYLTLWNKETFAALEQLSAEADKQDVSMAGLALAWLLNHPQVTAPIVGPRRPAHLQPIREALNLSLAQETWEAVGSLFKS